MDKKTVRFETPKTDQKNGGKFSTTPCSIQLDRRSIFKEKGKLSNNVLSTTKTIESFEPSTPKAHIEFSMELKKVINERNILTSKTRKRVFEALDEIKNKGEEKSRVLKREKALLEIVNSEIKYVHQLETIMIFFKEPVEHRKLLKPEDFLIIFGNIETIYRVNKELLDELDKGFDNIANAFSKIGPFLKLYSVYASEFKHILNMLQVIQKLRRHLLFCCHFKLILIFLNIFFRTLVVYIHSLPNLWKTKKLVLKFKANCQLY